MSTLEDQFETAYQNGYEAGYEAASEQEYAEAKVAGYEAAKEELHDAHEDSPEVEAACAGVIMIDDVDAAYGAEPDGLGSGA